MTPEECLKLSPGLHMHEHTCAFAPSQICADVHTQIRTQMEKCLPCICQGMDLILSTIRQ